MRKIFLTAYYEQKARTVKHLPSVFCGIIKIKGDFMEYKYHCQKQAEEFVCAILPVPNDYLLQKGLPADFREQFAKLCALAKDIYADMAQNPEGCGLKLVGIEETDWNTIRLGKYSLYRFADMLLALFAQCELKDHCAIVPMTAFIAQTKKRRSDRKPNEMLVRPIPKYELVLSRLSEFGFVFSNFNGKPFGKNVESFTVEYPDDPEMIATICNYLKCWDDVLLSSEPDGWKGKQQEFYAQYYLFDYKITADREAIPTRQWFADYASKFHTPELCAFALAFYDYSCKYEEVRFDKGEFYYKAKPITSISDTSYGALGKPTYKVSIKISKAVKFIDEVYAMPEAIQKFFRKGYCIHPNEDCSHGRFVWEFEGKKVLGCHFHCFSFDELNAELVPHYWRLLELQHALKRSKE